MTKEKFIAGLKKSKEEYEQMTFCHAQKGMTYEFCSGLIYGLEMAIKLAAALETGEYAEK